MSKFKVGDKVTYTDTSMFHSKYTSTVRSVTGTHYSLQIEPKGMQDPQTGNEWDGKWYSSEKYLKRVKENKRVKATVTKPCEPRYVTVKFSSSHDANYSDSYTYKDSFETPLEKYDVVLVPTRYGHSLAIVDRANEKSPSYSGNVLEVAEKITSKVLEKAMKKERAAELTKKLEKKVAELDKLNRFKQYVNENDDIAEMVKQLEALQ